MNDEDVERRMAGIERRASDRGDRLVKLEVQLEHISKTLQTHLHQEDADRAKIMADLRTLHDEVVRAHTLVRALLWIGSVASAFVIFAWDKVVAWLGRP